MERRKISAKEAVRDIRSGMDDALLMKKHGLSPEGLQSLYDKLVNKGFIDLGEMQMRLSGFLGTVFIPEAEISAQKDQFKHEQFKSKPRRTVNAQEAARDIRSGIDDAMLMEKYQISPKEFRSLFDKLMSLGLLTQKDCDRRAGIDDHTVDLREEKLSLSDAFRQLERSAIVSQAVEIDAEPEQSRNPSITKGSTQKKWGPEEEETSTTSHEKNPEDGWPEIYWYDQPIILLLFLIAIFPLGLYGLYRTQRFSKITKALFILGWLAVTIVWVLFLLGRI